MKTKFAATITVSKTQRPAPAPDAPQYWLIAGGVCVAEGWGRKVEAGPAIPDEVRLGFLRGPKLKVRSPIRLTVARPDDTVTVESAGLETSGRGPHLSAAIDDFQKRVADRYWSLRGQRDGLDPALAELWERFQAMIEEVDLP
jgi:hypothetical protein